MATATVLSTPRLVLRPVTEADSAVLLALWNDPVVRRVHGLGMQPLAEAAVVDWLREPGRALAWIACERLQGRPVGVVEMGGVEGAAESVFELGIALSSQDRGLGYGPELVERLCAWAFEAAGAAAVVAEVRLDNRAALRVFHASGFVDETVVGVVVRMRRPRPDAS